MVNGFRSGVAIRRRESRVVRSESMITRRSPSGLSSMIRPGFARSASSAESFAAWVRSELLGFHGSAIRSDPPFNRTLWKSTSGDLPPGAPLPSRSTSSKFIRPLRCLMRWITGRSSCTELSTTWPAIRLGSWYPTRTRGRSASSTPLVSRTTRSSSTRS